MNVEDMARQLERQTPGFCYEPIDSEGKAVYMGPDVVLSQDPDTMEHWYFRKTPRAAP